MATQRTSKQSTPGTKSSERLLRLYEPYRFLEASHWGEYLVVSDDGRYVVDAHEVEAVKKAVGQFGSGLTIFKVGEIAAGRLPWLKVQ